MYRSTDKGDSWTLANIGLTSTAVAALVINGSNYHGLHQNRVIWVRESGCFDSLITVIQGRNKTEASQHLYVNNVVINSIGHTFADAVGWGVSINK